MVIKHGQLDERLLLKGLGRKIRFYQHGADIWEGHFENDKLHGFGRHLKIYCEQVYSIHLGKWKNEAFMGTEGKELYNNTKYDWDCLPEDAKFVPNECTRTYDHEKAHQEIFSEYITN